MDASSRNSTNLGDSGIFPEPHVGMEFDSEKAAKIFYEDYARHLGFAPQVHHERSKSNGKEMCREFSCSVDRFKKGACVAMLRIELSSKNKWTVTKFVKEHNHPTLNHNKLHCIQLKRHFATMGVDVVPNGVIFAMEGAVTQETYNVALASVREGIKKVGGVKKSVANVGCDDKGTNTGNPETTPLLWPRQDEITPRFNLNDAGVFRSVSDAAAIRVAPHSINCDAGRADKVPVLPCLKSMTWIMENKNSTTANKIAVINLKLQDYSKSPPVESEVKFSLSRATLEPMLRSMAYITDQLTAPASNVAIINLKLQDPVTTSVESEVKFQLSRDTLAAMLRSMAYIREQLSNAVEPKPEAPAKRLRK
ncbi:FAR1-related sequence 3 [Striga asiatica]|uniref:FAR1-related sequence 3 n=1 Tax=Striga asiatica TaxID=4170 RepID=A0A5A7RAD6_STRAF|nr:FAR1-related sequence 3 [Striga asiatica]